MKMNRKIYLLIIFFILAIYPVTSFAASLELTWKAPSTGGEVKGYNIYYSTNEDDVLGQIPIIVIGNTPRYTLTGLEMGQTYYIVIKAFNDNGESEGYSMKAYMRKKPENLKIKE